MIDIIKDRNNIKTVINDLCIDITQDVVIHRNLAKLGVDDPIFDEHIQLVALYIDFINQNNIFNDNEINNLYKLWHRI